MATLDLLGLDRESIQKAIQRDALELLKVRASTDDLNLSTPPSTIDPNHLVPRELSLAEATRQCTDRNKAQPSEAVAAD